MYPTLIYHGGVYVKPTLMYHDVKPTLMYHGGVLMLNPLYVPWGSLC